MKGIIENMQHDQHNYLYNHNYHYSKDNIIIAVTYHSCIGTLCKGNLISVVINCDGNKLGCDDVCEGG